MKFAFSLHRSEKSSKKKKQRKQKPFVGEVYKMPIDLDCDESVIRPFHCRESNKW
jgi:hypothetical protein